MTGRVYIETTIPSAFASSRTDPSSVHRRELTRAWWADQRARYDVWTSDAVVLELVHGDWPGKVSALELVEPLARVPVTEEAANIARRYLQERLVPGDLQGDALHLALACVYEFDFLLTWNIRHLANPNKMAHLTVINRRLGLLTPQVVTPEMLWLEDER
jgi:PIN domain